MTTFLAFALVCSIAVSAPDCTEATALSAVSQPASAGEACGRLGQVLAAEAFGAPEPGRYIKTGCRRRAR